MGEMKLFDDGEIIPDWINSEFSNIYKGLIIDLCKDQPFLFNVIWSFRNCLSLLGLMMQ